MSDCEFSEEEIAAVNLDDLACCQGCLKHFIRDMTKGWKPSDAEAYYCDACRDFAFSDRIKTRREQIIEYLRGQQEELKKIMSDCVFSEEEIAAVDIDNLMECRSCRKLFIQRNVKGWKRWFKFKSCDNGVYRCETCLAIERSCEKKRFKKQAIKYLKQQRELKNE
jgi:hypothetical protein